MSKVSIKSYKEDELLGKINGGGQEDEGRSPGEKGAGGVQEAEKGGAGSGIPKMVGSSRNRGKLCNTAQYFTMKRAQRGGSQKNRAGTGIKGNGKQVV